ncbi:MAG: chromate efflux transporter [Burkholderiaceae bacterium]
MTDTRQGRAWEVFLAFLKLGISAFGGPVAHLGYFHTEFVERRRWLDEGSYADLVAVCQFLPGPTSSQVGIALGLRRAGWPGALCAWLGFTLPSALLLVAFAYGITHHAGLATSGAVQGLKIVAVAVVAQAVMNMARTLCPDRLRAGLALLAALIALALPWAAGQVGAMLIAGLLGRLLIEHAPLECSPQAAAASAGPGVSRRSAVLALGLFAGLLLGLPVVASTTGSAGWALIDGFFRAGSLVFGGGHVILPLLQAVVVPTGVVDNAQFLAGYGAAQAVPGPLTSFAAFLGTVAHGPLSGWSGGLVLLAVIFAPSFLLVAGVLPFWDALRQRAGIRPALAGINAGVVGILLAALYDPVWTGAIHGRLDFGLGLAAFGLLVYGRLSPVIVVGLGALAGWALG